MNAGSASVVGPGAQCCGRWGIHEQRLQTYGVPYEVIPEDYRRGRALRLQAPSGHTVELYHEMDYTGNLLPTGNPAPWPDGRKGIAPPRLDHT